MSRILNIQAIFPGKPGTDWFVLLAPSDLCIYDHCTLNTFTKSENINILFMKYQIILKLKISI